MDAPSVLPTRRWVRPVSYRTLALAAAVVVAAALVPVFANTFVTRLMILFFMSAAMAQSWNLIAGYAGYPSFGHVVFFGLGAYTTGLLMRGLDAPFVLALAAAVVLAVLLALFISPILRLRGAYFVVMTFGIAEAGRELILNGGQFTGGGNGVQLPIAPITIQEINTIFYYVMLAVVVGAAAGTYLITRSRLGYALIAVRENELAAREMGVNTVRAKMIVLLLSGGLAAIPGSVYAYWMSYISAQDVFHITRSIEAVLASLLGGSGTVVGPIIGAGVLSALREFTWSNFNEMSDAVLGLMIIAVVLFLPGGMMTLVRDGRRAIGRAAILENLRRYRA